MRVRLLNKSIYRYQVDKINPMLNDASYPVIVSAEIRKDFKNAVNVHYSELDRVFPILFPGSGKQYKRDNPTLNTSGSDGLSWWNEPIGNAVLEEKSWEPVSPFEYWNKLKSSREVGDVVPAGYL